MRVLSAPAAALRPALLTLLLLLSCDRKSGEGSSEPSQDTPSSAPPAASVATAPAATATPSNEAWNPAQIEWQTFASAEARSSAENKPICLVFSATWCAHCKNYSKVFDDPRIVAHAKDFEMVHADVDAEPLLAAKYAPDGGYVPRTYFIGPDGALSEEIHAPRPRFKYFYDEKDPGSLLAGMDASLRKLGR
jgi:thiol-disulfide isomerase/thioredoxin